MAKRRQEDEADVLERAEVAARLWLEAEDEPCIIDLIWARLDQKMDWLMGQPAVAHSAGPVAYRDYAQLQGAAKGLAEALAIFQHPYEPVDEAVDMIRHEAVERYERRQRATVVKPKPRKRASRRPK